MRKLITILFMGSVTFLVHACYYDKEQLLTAPKGGGTAPATCASYSFKNDVSPIIQASCSNSSGCHGSGSSAGPGALVTYSEIRSASSQIQSSVLAGRMPLGSSLSSSQIQIINCWVKNGALNN
jgi:hypothetical protein